MWMLLVHLASAAEGSAVEVSWESALADEIVALPDTEARRARLARELTETSDPVRAARVGDAVSVVLSAEGVDREVLRARLVLALSGEPAAAPARPATRSPMERDYWKRAIEVRTEDDGSWGVYRVASGKPMSGRTFVHMTHDEPLYARLRRARAFAYVGAGVLGACAVTSATLGYLNYLTTLYAYDPDDPYAEPEPSARENATTAGYVALAAGCAAGAVVLPVATVRRQSDVHHYYDEARAREVVDGYDAALRQRYGMSASEREGVDVAVYAGLDGVGVRGTF